MVVVGLLAGTDALVRGVPPRGDPLAFYILPITDLVNFTTLVFFAFRARFNPEAHKRIILIATIALTPAAIARLPFALVHRKPPMAYLVSYIFLLLLVGYDLWSTRKIHRATLWAGGFVVFIHQISRSLAKTAAWHAFAGWVQTLARG
jgi:FtsH-binding integral membrane protein